MSYCEVCSEKVLLPFECNFCGGKFCMIHRLPENHDCTSTPMRTPLGYWKAKKPTKKWGTSIEEPKEITKQKHGIFTGLSILGLWLFFIVLLALGTCVAYIHGLDWAFTVNLGEGLAYYLPIAFVLAMCHELLHAIAWWSFGYFAIPIPILIPPILGITIGPKPKKHYQTVIISLAPILLSVFSYLSYQNSGNERHLFYAGINLIGMLYDFISIFKK